MITTFCLPNFGEIDLDVQSSYYASIKLENNIIEVDINFDSNMIRKDAINQIKNFFDQLPTYNIQNLEYIDVDFKKQDGPTREYLAYHISKFGKNMSVGLSIGGKKSDLPTLNLRRVGIYPEDEHFAVCDYTFLDFETDYLLVVNVDSSGKLINIKMES